MGSDSEKPKLVTVGLSSSMSSLLKAGLDIFEKIEHPYSQQIIEEPVDGAIAALLCGPPMESFSVVEVGQSLRMLYPEKSIYFVTDNRLGFDRKEFQKNGFTEAFLLPNDMSLLTATLQRDASLASDGKIKSFRPVQLGDIEPDTVLGFDVYIYLPANNRRIRYVSGNESLGAERAKKLQKHQHQSILVSEDEMPKFYQYTAQQLKKITNDTKISETERAEKRQRAVRELLTDFFADPGKGDNIEHGRQILADCQEVIKAYILDGPDGLGSWYARVLAFSNADSTTYSHASNTSTIAALLSIATGFGDPKEVALGGLLHDIGMSMIPAEICLKAENLRTPEEEKKVQQHPLYSIELLKQRKLIVSENVVAMIEQHHERFDGKGYPTQMPGPRILKEAQLIAVASALDKETSVKEGQPRISLKDAMIRLCEQGLSSPGLSAFDPSLLRKLKSIFIEEAKKYGEVS